jgi:hypothetical protein
MAGRGSNDRLDDFAIAVERITGGPGLRSGILPLRSIRHSISSAASIVVRVQYGRERAVRGNAIGELQESFEKLELGVTELGHFLAVAGAAQNRQEVDDQEFGRLCLAFSARGSGTLWNAVRKC